LTAVRRLLVPAALTLAGVAFAVAALTAVPVGLWNSPNWLNPAGYVLVDEVFRHPFALATAACVAFGLAAALALRSTAARGTVAFVTIGLASVIAVPGIALALGGTVLADPDATQPTRYTAPGGGFDVIVTPGSRFQGPTWRVAVRTRDGLGSRQHHVACYDGDNPDYGFDSLQWIGPDTVRLVRGDGTVDEVRFASGTGQPDRTIGDRTIC
jgi:hypothetical protein